jgi:virginiamycin A acetyltransferase
MRTITHALTENNISALMDKRIYFWIDDDNRLQVGQHLVFREDAVCEPYCAILDGLEVPSIGSFSYSWSGLPPGMKVGRYCSISLRLSIMTDVTHPITFTSTSPFTYDWSFVIFRKALEDDGVIDYTRYPFPETRRGRNDLPIIENDVWIGTDVILARGITLGTGCIVAAHSVVTKSVPPYAIVGGNPAKVIRQRFPDETVARMLGSEWWRYSFTGFGAMRYDEADRFLDQFEQAVTTGAVRPMAENSPTLLSILRAE